MVTKALSSDRTGDAGAVVPSRRDVLAGLGWVGMFAVAGSALLTSSPAEARVNPPVIEPEPAPAEVAEAEAAASDGPEHLADTTEFEEFSAQWRRRYGGRRSWRGVYVRRRHWRRRPWRGVYVRRRHWRRRYRRRYW